MIKNQYLPDSKNSYQSIQKRYPSKRKKKNGIDNWQERNIERDRTKKKQKEESQDSSQHSGNFLIVIINGMNKMDINGVKQRSYYSTT